MSGSLIAPRLQTGVEKLSRAAKDAPSAFNPRYSANIFQKDNRSIEYKTQSWKLADDRKSITFTDKNGIGRLKMKGTGDLNFYQPDQIKRVRLVKRADGYYVQFCVQVAR